MQDQFTDKQSPMVMAHWTRERGFTSWITRCGTPLVAKIVETQDAEGVWVYWQPYPNWDYAKLPSWTRPLMRFTKRPKNIAVAYLAFGIFLLALVPYFHTNAGLLLSGIHWAVGTPIVYFLICVARVRLGEESVAVPWPLEHTDTETELEI